MLEEDNPPKDWRRNGEYLNIAEILEKTLTEGPGIRFAIWVQGCPIRCDGCWNPHMWDFNPKHIVKVDKLVEYILSFSDEIEGITLVGGEPLAQARAISNLIRKIKRLSDLTVVLYTGYNVEQIKGKYKLEAFNMSDIVIAGPFIKDKRNLFLRWRGSENQKIIFHNKEYEKRYSIESFENQVEIHVDEESGKISLIGYPDEEILKEAKE